MALSPAQIAVLRFAQNSTEGVYQRPICGDIRLAAQFPLRGAVALTVIRSLKTRGLLSASGYITETGTGALLNDPQASSEVHGTP